MQSSAPQPDGFLQNNLAEPQGQARNVPWKGLEGALTADNLEALGKDSWGFPPCQGPKSFPRGGAEEGEFVFAQVRSSSTSRPLSLPSQELALVHQKGLN